MNIKKENISYLHELITIELVPEDYQTIVSKSLKNIRQNIEIPGFRKKMIPIEIIDKKHGESIRESNIAKLIDDTILEYVRENKLNLLLTPIYCKDKSSIDFTKNGDYRFSFEIGIRPEIKINYAQAKDVIYYKIIATEEEIEHRMMYLRRQLGVLSPTETVGEEDILTVNVSYGKKTFISTLPLNYLKNEEISRFIGKRTDEEMDIDTSKIFNGDEERLTFLKLEPDKLETAPTDVHIKINSIHHVNIADVDARFFNQLFPDGSITTETELRKFLKYQIERPLQQDTDALYREDVTQIWAKDISTQTFPDAFIKKYFIETNKLYTEENIESNYDDIKKVLINQLIDESLISDLKVNVYHHEVLYYLNSFVRQNYFGSTKSLDKASEEQIRNYALELMKDNNNLNNAINLIIFSKVTNGLKGKLNPTIKELSYTEFMNELIRRRELQEQQQTKEQEETKEQKETKEQEYKQETETEKIQEKEQPKSKDKIRKPRTKTRVKDKETNQESKS
jgi:trigger factor